MQKMGLQLPGHREEMGLACGDAHTGRATCKRNMSALRATGVIQGQAGCFLDETRAWLEC